MKKRMITAHKIYEFEVFLKDGEKSSATIEKYLRDVRFLPSLQRERISQSRR